MNPIRHVFITSYILTLLVLGGCASTSSESRYLETLSTRGDPETQKYLIGDVNLENDLLKKEEEAKKRDKKSAEVQGTDEDVAKKETSKDCYPAHEWACYSVLKKALIIITAPIWIPLGLVAAI